MATTTHSRGARRLVTGALLLVPGPLVGATIALSPDPTGGWSYPVAQRLLYVHVPLAWVAYAGYGVAAVAALFVLSRDRRDAGRVMRAANEANTVFAAGALTTGFAWGYEFGIWDPLSDPKVLSTVVLVAVLAGLWAVAASTPPPRRDRLVAALTLAGSVAVPASYLASRLASPHPDFATTTSISGELVVLLLIAVVGFQALFAGIVLVRTRLMLAETTAFGGSGRW